MLLLTVSGFLLNQGFWESELCVFTALLHRPLISVVVPVYRTTFTLERAIRSCMVQSFPDYEIVIVADSPRDFEWAAIQNLSFRFGVIHLVEAKNWLGLFLARRSGVLRSKGTIIMSLDADDKLCDGIFQRIADVYTATSAEIIQFHAHKVLVDDLGRESGGVGFDYRQCRLGLFGRSQVRRSVQQGCVRWNICFSGVRRRLYVDALRFIYPSIHDNLYCLEDKLQTFTILHLATSMFLMNFCGYLYYCYSTVRPTKKALLQSCHQDATRVNIYLARLWGSRKIAL